MLPGLLLRALCLSAVMTATAAMAAEEYFHVELNVLEPSEGRCFLTFVTENKRATNFAALKVRFSIFNTQGIRSRGLAVDLGPLRAKRTVERTFGVDGECTTIGRVLLSEVSDCAPGEREACEDGIELASKVDAVRFYK
jgi:hypothetical protein